MNIPVVHGQPDTALAPGSGGIAVRAIDGTTGWAIGGAQFVLSRDTAGIDWSAGVGAVSQGGIALIRGVEAGLYAGAFQSLGFQAFRTMVEIPAGRVDTMVVTVYRAPVCLTLSQPR